MVFVVLVLGASVWAGDYEDGIADAQAARSTEWADTVFSSLTKIDASRVENITVPDGGGSKTIEAVKVITLTSYLVPYTDATYLKAFTVSTTDLYRSNMWVTVNGDIQSYYSSHNLPTTDNTVVTSNMQEALGMSHLSGYKALVFYVEPKYLTRPSFAPSITANVAPTWAETNYTFTNVMDANAEFWGFAPTILGGDGKYQRPFGAFEGLGAEGVTYEAWLDAWSAASFNLTGGREFPYTGLGWTWNWNTDPTLNGFALSEFLVSGNATYYFSSLTDAIALVPEPGTIWLLLGIGGGGFLLRMVARRLRLG